MADDKIPVNWSTFALSCVTRILFWGLTIFIIYLCFRSGYSHTTIHVASCTGACTLMMIEATLIVSGDALLSRKFSKRALIRIHWMNQFVGLEMVVIGAGTIIYNQIQEGEFHFATFHGKVGLVGTIFSVLVGIAAVPTLHEKLLFNMISIGSFRRGHIYLAMISLILLWAGQITGFYTHWWTASDIVTYLAITAYVIGGFCLLARPLYRTLKQSFNQ